MLYHLPHTVLSPKDLVENIIVIHDGLFNGYSLVEIEWDGQPCLAMRWNVAQREHGDPQKINLTKKCVGMPSSRGYPVWFIIPDDFLDRGSDVWKKIEKHINKKKKNDSSQSSR